MKYGYVTQLHTFVWLKISKKIKMKVEEDIEKESAGRKRSNPVTPSVEKDHKLLATDNTSKAYSDGPSDANIRRTRANKPSSLPSSGIGVNSNPYNTDIVIPLFWIRGGLRHWRENGSTKSSLTSANLHLPWFLCSTNFSSI